MTSLSHANVGEIDLPGASTEISNSIAVDKYGGIYVVTASNLNRFQWDPTVSHTLYLFMSDALSHHSQGQKQHEAHYDSS